MNPYTESELDTLRLMQTGTEVAHGSQHSQTRPYSSLRIVFMRVGIAEIDEETIPEQLGDVPIVALDNLGTHLLIGTDDFPVLFGVEVAGELGRVHQVAEHHSQLPSLSFWGTRFG